VTDKNEPPQFLAQSREVPENSLANTDVGLPLSAVDPDKGQTVSFAIVGGTHQSSFTMSSTGQLKVADGAQLDFEGLNGVGPTLNLLVRATDSHPTAPLSTTAAVTVKLTNVNEPPS